MHLPLRLWIVAGVFVSLLTACNLQIAEETEAPITEIPAVLIVTATASPTLAIPTTVPTVATVAIPASQSGSVPIVNCVPSHPEWQNYTVQSGDTLASIASRTNSTVNTLATVNCIADANQISTGQILRVPQSALPSLPLIDNGPVPANVCGVEPLIAPVNIYGDGGATIALLQGTVLVTGRIDTGYFVSVPDLPGGYVLANEVRELGSNCPEVSLPVVNQTPPEISSCMVVSFSGYANIYRPGPAMPVAHLIQAEFVRIADNAYIINTPELGGESQVSRIEAGLSGTSCPEDTLPLPVITGTGAIPTDRCSVVLNTPNAIVGIKYGYSDVYAPIAVLGNWLPYVEDLEGGYTVELVGMDMYGWVNSSNVHLEGNCDGEQPVDSYCIDTYTSDNPVTISPSTIVEDDCVSVTTGTVTVSLPDAPSNFSMVEFWVQSANGNTDVIGTDTNPADGASITYEITPYFKQGLFYAFVYGGNHPDSGQVAVKRVTS